MNNELRNDIAELLRETAQAHHKAFAATVPVLRITSPDGEDRWMPESRDIVSYLQKTYA